MDKKVINLAEAPHGDTSTDHTGSESKPPLFDLGKCLISNAALAHCQRHGVRHLHFFERHTRGDWGNVSPEQARENDASLHKAWHLLSLFEVAGRTIAVDTEAGREITTLQFLEEYES